MLLLALLCHSHLLEAKPPLCLLEPPLGLLVLLLLLLRQLPLLQPPLLLLALLLPLLH